MALHVADMELEQAGATSDHDLLTAGSHAVTAVRAALHELEVVADANERPAVSRQRHNRKGTENGIDGAALEAELAEV